MLQIYKYMENEWSLVPYDITREEEDRHDARICKQAADRYGVTQDQVVLVHGFVSMNYDIVNSAAGYDTTTAEDLTVPYGDVLKCHAYGSVLDIGVKISGLLTDSTTINQNYYNIADLILKQGADAYTTIYYAGYMPAQGGGNAVVISFTVPAHVIDSIKNRTVMEVELPDYVEDLWIHPQLKG